MSIFENFEKKLQAEPKSIVFTEGTDARILSAASRLLAGKTLKVILLGEVEAVKKAAADGSFDITGAEIIDPTNYAGFDEMVAKMVELRKGKMTTSSAAPLCPRATTSAPCWSRWAKLTACWAVPPILPPIPSAPRCSSSSASLASSPSAPASS